MEDQSPSPTEPARVPDGGAAMHTPGPWRVSDGAMRYIVADGHMGPLCDIRSRLDYPGMDPIVADTLDANARLIAAAPDLLAAVVAADGAVKYAMAAANSEADYERLCAVQDALWAAIAKARGA